MSILILVTTHTIIPKALFVISNNEYTKQAMRNLNRSIYSLDP